MFSLLKKIFILIALLGTIGLGYFMYTQRDSGMLSDTSNAAVTEDVAREAAEFLSRLEELKSIQLDSDILSDPRFGSLSSLSLPVESEPVGRPNPFELN